MDDLCIIPLQLMYSIGDDLLRTATQSPKSSLQKTKAGWVLLGALMTLGEFNTCHTFEFVVF